MVRVDTTELPSDDGLDEFRSESEGSSELVQTVPTVKALPPETEAGDPPLPYVRRRRQYGRGLVTAGVTVLLGVAVTGVILDTPTASEQSFAPRVEMPAAKRPKSESATGAVRPDPRIVARPAPAKAAAAVGASRADVSRRVRRQPVTARAAARPSSVRARLPNGRVSSVATPRQRPLAPAPPVTTAEKPADGERSAPETRQQDPATASVGALVSVTASNSDGDALTFRWSAPVGRFADATARETRFFCPDTPQSVPVTVTVTDGKGAAASDTITVQCVARTR
jgi:hypothetical protein